MSALECAADRLRHEWHRQQHLPPPPRWQATHPREQRRWLALTHACLEGWACVNDAA